MSDKINNSTQISSKEHAVNRTTTNFFVNCLYETAVAYEYNHRRTSIFGDTTDPGSVPS